MNLFEKYTLNEQLQQAYEAGRRQGLNEDAPPFEWPLQSPQYPYLPPDAPENGYWIDVDGDGRYDFYIAWNGWIWSVQDQIWYDENGNRSKRWHVRTLPTRKWQPDRPDGPDEWRYRRRDDTSPKDSLATDSSNSSVVTEQFRGSEPIHGVPTHTPPNYSPPPSTQSNPAPSPAGGSEIMYYYGTGQYLPNHLLWADHDGDGMFGWNDYIYLSAAHGGGFVGPM